MWELYPSYEISCNLSLLFASYSYCAIPFLFIFLFSFLKPVLDSWTIVFTLFYTAVLISTIQQSDSVYIYTLIYIYVFFVMFFFTMVYHRILSMVPCVILQDLVVFPPYV